MPNSIFRTDWIILTVILLLSGLSLAVLFPISYAIGNTTDADQGHFIRQLVFLGLGFATFFLFALSDYRVLRGLSPVLFLGGVVLLIGVLVFGKIVRGTTGWISIGIFNLQPVEPFKLVIAIALAKYFSLNRKTIRLPGHIFRSAVPVFFSVALIMAQPDLGSALVIISAWMGILLLSGVSKKYLAVLLVISLIVGFLGWNYFLKGYQKERLRVLISPETDPLGTGYNVLQSIVAVGSGGLWGKGLGHGSQSQLNFLPEKHTDFIFAVISEELGFAGSLFVLALLLLLLSRMFIIARDSRDNFGKLLVGTFAVIIFVQIIINIGMNIGLAPVAGIPLPFLSYGGSALITSMAMLGIASSVQARNWAKNA